MITAKKSPLFDTLPHRYFCGRVGATFTAARVRGVDRAAGHRDRSPGSRPVNERRDAMRGKSTHRAKVGHQRSGGPLTAENRTLDRCGEACRYPVAREIEADDLGCRMRTQRGQAGFR